MNEFIDRLHHQMRQPLPGQGAQFKMASLTRVRPTIPPPTARQAGVLALFYPKAGEWHIVLIERMDANPNDRHGGQISFPGGKFEKADGTLLQTALRESQEEIGIDAATVNVLGPLTQMYIPVSNFLVNPFVGYLDYTPVFSPQAEEVKSVLEIPFNLFYEPGIISQTDIRVGGNMMLRDVPYFDLQGKVLWGATAMMMNELIEVVALK